MKIWLNKHFGFSRGEFNGLLALLVLIVLLKLVPVVYRFLEPEDPYDPKLMASIQKISISEAVSNYSTRARVENERSAHIKYFKFDPNTIGLSGWQSLGLSVRQAQSVLNYINKGGKFYKAEDLQKMYAISPDVYQKLLPFIEIESKGNLWMKNHSAYKKTVFEKRDPVVIELNAADSAQLDEIKGIGPAFARRILKYRERLGGFYKKEQLLEVYGLDSARFEEIKTQVSIDLQALKMININQAGFEELKGNPYLSFKQINALIQYRKQHGRYSGVEDLKKVDILSPQVIDKIAPYLLY